MVGQADLPNAIALNSMAFNAARVLGPSLGGFMVDLVGESWCFALNAVSYLAVIVSYLMMDAAEPEREHHPSAWGHFLEGWRYTRDHRPLRTLLGLSTITNFASAPVMVLAPVFADAIFHRGARGYGLLTGAFGLGAIGGTFRLASHRSVRAMPRMVAFAAISVGVATVLFSMAPAYAICLAAMLLCGFSVMTQLPGTNMLVQTLVAEDYRGRVMALYTMSVVGMIPLGNLAAGALAEVVGVRWTAFAGGLVCLVGGAAFARSKHTIEAALEEGK
jgi:MFS family permease